MGHDLSLRLLFSWSSAVVMPFWLLMLAAPRWRWTVRVLQSPLVIAGPVAIYAALVLPRLGVLLPALARPQLPLLAGLLGTPEGAMIAWAHFLALDLLAGRWIFLDARARGLSSWIVSPLLALTLMFAPLGLAAYGLVRGARAARVRAWAGRLAALHRPLALVTFGALGLLAASLILLAVDGRQILGAPVWMKPAKFAVSIALLAPTLAWIIAQMPGRRVRAGGTVMAGVAALELVIITVQAARGVPSHFNNATALDAGLFATMGAAITLLWIVELLITVQAFRQQFESPARTWAIRLGLAGALAGGAVGFLMPIPTPAQRAQIAGGQRPALVGGHSVGAPDGGPGLPVTRWSTRAGDLRVPHFLGLHALQVLPLAAWLLERRRRRGGRPVIALGMAWIGLTLVTLAQALRGQPVTAPDGVTLATIFTVGVSPALVALVPWGRTNQGSWGPAASADRARS